MTNLPTRPDGGIDWEKINLGRTNSHPYVSGGKSWGIVEFAREAAAHTRERCAKLAHECWENGIPAQEIAQRIRRMEE